ncbi:MAG: hypothetical protein Q4B17_00980 [Lautropia sp.]|nr:hypothetical protein [Lautropia sp.]
MTGPTLPQDLPLFFLMLPDWIEQGAHWILLCAVLLAGFVLAWGIQASRRRRVVFQLWEAHQRRQQEQLEECRLLAEDQAIEQASQLAYQARRIEQLKAALARQPALIPDNATNVSPVGQHAAAGRFGTVAGAHSIAGGHPGHGPDRPPMAARPAHPASASAHRASTQQVSETVQALLKKRLARELHLSREKARLMRRYEAESVYWQQACLHSRATCDSLQAAVTALENALHDTRQTWAAAEREVERLRQQLAEQRTRSLPGFPGNGMAGTHFTLQSTHDDSPGEGQPPLSRVRYHYAALAGTHRVDTPAADTLLDHHSS